MSFARGFIKGFIGQSLDKKAAADKLLGDLNTKVADRYLTEIQPNFIKNEKNIESRYNSISKNISEPVALYAMAQGFTNTDYDTNRLLQLEGPDLDQLKNYASTIDFGNYNFELAKNTRALNYNEKYSGVTNQIKTMAGGSGPAVTGLLIPYDETMGASTFDATQLKPLSDITARGNNFDIMNRAHATEANRFSGDFDQYFFDRNMQSYRLDRDKNDPAYPIIQSLLSDYDDAVAREYKGGKLQYARDKFINEKLSQMGIMNYPRPGYDDLPEAKTTAKTIDTSNIDVNQQTENVITKSPAKKIDTSKSTGKKIDTSKSPGKKFDTETSPGIRVTDESGAIMNEVREAISQISRSNLPDEQKEKAIADVRAAAKEEIKKIGLNPDNFSF